MMKGLAAGLIEEVRAPPDWYCLAAGACAWKLTVVIELTLNLRVVLELQVVLADGNGAHSASGRGAASSLRGRLRLRCCLYHLQLLFRRNKLNLLFLYQ